MVYNYTRIYNIIIIFFLLQIYHTTGTLEYSNDHQSIIGCSNDYSGDVIIPASVIEIISQNLTHNAFMNCKNNITSIIFEANSRIKKICVYSFCYTGIFSADLSKCTQLTFLNDSVFRGCSNMTSIVLPPKITGIGENCFRVTSQLRSIEVPDSVTNIFISAFESSGISDIQFNTSSKLTKLYSNCFAKTKLTSLYIPKNVNLIDPTAIALCPIERIDIDILNIYYKIVSDSVYYGIDNSTLFCVFNYSSEYIIPRNVVNIMDYCFYKVKKNITSIKLHEDIFSIGKSAFSGCNISSMRIPNKISIINSGCFSSCLFLEEITFEGNITKIGTAAFSSCIKLKSIQLPESLEYLDLLAFYNCTSLTSITIPGNVSVIFGSFGYCINLNKIIFKENKNISLIAPFYSTIYPARIYIPGLFYANTTSPSGFPRKCHLYITNQTRLSEYCKKFFGEKSIYVHYTDKIKITDEITIDVLKNISIAVILSKSIKKARSKYFSLLNIIHR